MDPAFPISSDTHALLERDKRAFESDVANFCDILRCLSNAGLFEVARHYLLGSFGPAAAEAWWAEVRRRVHPTNLSDD